MPQDKKYANETMEAFLLRQQQQRDLPRMEKPILTGVEFNDGPGNNAFKPMPTPTLKKPIGTIEYNQDGSIKNPGPAQVAPMKTPRYMQDFSQMGTAAQPYTKNQKDMEFQQKLKNMHFNIQVDGVYGPQTAKADRQYNEYLQKGFDDQYISNIMYAKKQGYPAHLLEDGNVELYKKWQSGINNLSDEEYKMVFPEARTNKEIYQDTLMKVKKKLNSFNLFDAIKNTK
jgi:hypothetical protein